MWTHSGGHNVISIFRIVFIISLSLSLSFTGDKNSTNTNWKVTKRKYKLQSTTLISVVIFSISSLIQLYRTSSAMYDFNQSSGLMANRLEDRRAFELALEMSLLGLGNDNDNNHGGNNTNPLGFNTNFGNNNTTHLMGNNNNNNNNGLDIGDNSRFSTRRSQNTTECVPVPSSEHVAEIVGRQGKCLFLFVIIVFLNYWDSLGVCQSVVLFTHGLSIPLEFT